MGHKDGEHSKARRQQFKLQDKQRKMNERRIKCALKGKRDNAPIPGSWSEKVRKMLETDKHIGEHK